MKVTDHLKNTKKTIFSFEVLPPLKGSGIKAVYDMLDPLMEHKPPFINVTYHRSEYIYKKNTSGGFNKVFVRKRPGTIGICASIQNKYQVDAVPHLICGGFTKDATEDALIELHFLDIDNVLLLRGDAIKSESIFIPEDNGHAFALDLVNQVNSMNRGNYLDDDLQGVVCTNFCVGVAGYPEKHFEAPNLKSDLKFLKAKIDSGADYIITQMFFDNNHFLQFVKHCREEGITVPIIPGIKPITRKKQISTIPRTFHVDIPEALYDAIEACETNEAVEQVGTEWCVNQCKELMALDEVNCVHFFTMGNSKQITKILNQIG